MREALAAFKGNINKKNYIGKLSFSYNNHKKYKGYLRIIFGMSGVIDTPEAKIGDFIVDYLREFEVTCKKALTRESRDQ
jgi:hypothetical protein